MTAGIQAIVQRTGFDTASASLISLTGANKSLNNNSAGAAVVAGSGKNGVVDLYIIGNNGFANSSDIGHAAIRLRAGGCSPSN
jgi:hypothetical protein